MQELFIGTYSHYGIYKLGFENGSIHHISKQNNFENCSYLYKNNNKIYSVIEGSTNPSYENGCISCMNLDFSSPCDVISHGTSPCYIVLDKFRNLLFVANYSDGSMDVFSLDSNGNILSLLLHKNYSSTSHIHCIGFSNDYNFLFVTDLGTDTLFCYKINFNGIVLDLKDVCSYKFPSKSEPRHFSIIDNDLYVITESSCELYKLSFNKIGSFNFVSRFSLLPNNVIKKSDYTGCAIKISNDKNFIYTTIRGSNTISVFSLSKNIELLQTISCEGQTPRDIGFDFSDSYLLCANQNSNNISIFKRDKKLGYLTFESLYPIASPACIV